MEWRHAEYQLKVEKQQVREWVAEAGGCKGDEQRQTGSRRAEGMKEMKQQERHCSAWPFAFATCCAIVGLTGVSQVQFKGRQEELACTQSVTPIPFHLRPCYLAHLLVSQEHNKQQQEEELARQQRLDRLRALVAPQVEIDPQRVLAPTAAYEAAKAALEEERDQLGAAAFRPVHGYNVNQLYKDPRFKVGCCIVLLGCTSSQVTATTGAQLYQGGWV